MSRDARGTPPLAEEWRRVAELGGRREALRFGRSLVREVGRSDLLTFASAIAFQVFFALVPLALAGVAVLGFLSLDEVWRQDLAPRVQERTSDAGFTVIDQSVERILSSKETFWLTLGAGLALWEVSGSVRAIMGALNRIYRVEETRSFVRRFLTSFALAGAVGLGLLAAAVALHLGPRLADVLGGGLLPELTAFAVRWGAAIVLMLVVIGLLIRYAPARQEDVAWVGVVSLFTVAGWVVASLGFGWYATSIASYSSIFGSLAIVIVLLTYVYVSAVVFLLGVQIDSLLRRGWDGGG